MKNNSLNLSKNQINITKYTINTRRQKLTEIIVMKLRWADPPTKESYQMSVAREVH
jgi:hypothetical protein